ncbi:MAG: ferredoxin--NADP reductase [Acidobacteria bacterium]|nr:MAG: ferredoxin--NADP reductase [Acidobacteriota bacterium]
MDGNQKFYGARIVRRRDIAADLWSIRVQRDAEFHFLPGQYATLGVLAPHKHIERPYSIVSSPYESELEFFFELVPRGELTPALHKLNVGDELTMRKVAKGRFTLDLQVHRNHLLLCTVTGVAPFVSYIRTLSNDARQNKFPEGHRLFLLEGASRSWEFGYLEELKRIADEVPWFKYVPTVSRPWEDRNWTGEVGRVDDLIRKYTHLWELMPETTSAYLCGHPKMIDNSSGILVRRGWAKEHIKEEIYFVPKEHATAI